MAHRKLQQEIDRVFKKINEGLEIFDTLYERHGTCANPSQKEKLESDLKKEIKKLQRFREQIKNWQSTSEVKDKEKLLNHRKLVEHAMEQYKLVEKSSKTKAYSDQSLMNLKPKQMDPEEKERYETVQFLNTSLGELELQVEALEAEMDRIQGAKKGKKGSSFADTERKAEITEFLRIDRFHQEKWEQMLRLVENDVLAPAQVMEIKDGIEYFLESNQDSEFYEDDTIYDELNLDENDLVNEVNISLKEQKEREEADAAEAAAKEGTASPAPPGTPPKPRQVSATPAAPAAARDAQETPDSQQAAPAAASAVQQPVGNGAGARKVTPLAASFAAAAAATSVPVATSLKPAPVRSKPKEMSWSAAIAAAASQNDTYSNVTASSDTAASPSPVAKSESASPATRQTSISQALSQQAAAPASLSPAAVPNSANVGAADDQRAKQTLSATIKSASLAVAGASVEQLPAVDLVEDEDLLVLPPGLQDLITSAEDARKQPSRQIDSSASLLRGYRDFAPLPDTVVPNAEDAQKAYNTWMFVRGNGKIKELIDKIDPATLFYVYYYGTLNLEKRLAEQALFNRGWKLHKSNVYWLQRLGEPLLFQTYEQGHYRVFDATRWVVQEHPGFQLVYSDFRPDASALTGAVPPA